MTNCRQELVYMQDIIPQTDAMTHMNELCTEICVTAAHTEHYWLEGGK